MRVGLLTPILKMGGAERWLCMMAKYVPVYWTGCVVTNAEPIDRETSRELHSLIPLSAGPGEQHPWITRFDTTAEAVATLADQSDILIGWGSNYGAVSSKLVFTVHGPEHAGVLCERNKGARFVAVSKFVARSMPPWSDPDIIHNCIEPDRLVPMMTRGEWRAKYGIADSETVVGYLGRFDAEKEPTLCIHAARKLRCVAALMGSGPLDMAGFGQQAGVKTVVIPAARNVGDFLQGIDCLVSCWPKEGFGLSLVEAWAAGCPTVTVESGIATEYDCCVKVDCGKNHEALGKGVRMALDRRHVEEAKRVAARFTPEAFGRDWAEFLHSL